MDPDAFPMRRARALTDGALIEVTSAAAAAGLSLPTAMTPEAHLQLGAGDTAELARVLRELALATAAGGDAGDRRLALQGAGCGPVAVRLRLVPGDGGHALTEMTSAEA
jgi:hypothetical protein